MRVLASNAINYSMDSHLIKATIERLSDGRHKSPLNTFQIEKSCFRVTLSLLLSICILAHSLHNVLHKFYFEYFKFGKPFVLFAYSSRLSGGLFVALSISLSSAISQKLLSSAAPSPNPGKVKMKNFLLRLLKNRAKRFNPCPDS